MNITGARQDRFVEHPDPAIRSILVYGPDRGLVRERAEALCRSVVGDLGDPFRIVELPAREARSDPARLADEAAALSFSGGRRLVRIRDAGDGLSGVISDFLERSGGDALVVVEGGELSSRSALRKLFEKARNAAALACYPDEGSRLERIIVETLKRHELTPSPDALTYLARNLGADRVVTRNELEKLALYMGGPGAVSEEDARACIGDGGATSVDAVVYAAAGGDFSGLERALTRALMEGASAVSILRAMARHLARLHLAIGLVLAGQSPDQAMKALKPPVIFKFAERFRAQMRGWRSDNLATALALLTEAELECKTTGQPSGTICGRALLRVGHAVRRPTR